MKKRIWDLYAPIYKKAMQADQKIYDFMYERIPVMIRDMEVLEIATGPGLLAKHVAPAAKRMIATDYSDGMIAEAKKGDCRWAVSLRMTYSVYQWMMQRSVSLSKMWTRSMSRATLMMSPALAVDLADTLAVRFVSSATR